MTFSSNCITTVTACCVVYIFSLCQYATKEYTNNRSRACSLDNNDVQCQMRACVQSHNQLAILMGTNFNVLCVYSFERADSVHECRIIVCERVRKAEIR